MNYNIIYDVSNEHLKLGWLIPLSFFIFSLILWIINFKKESEIKLKVHPQSIDKTKKTIHSFILYPFLFLSFFASILVTSSQINGYFQTKERVLSKKYNIIEGIVTDYNCYQPRKSTKETFTINKVKFEFVENDESYYGYKPAYLNKNSWNGRFLKISYYKIGGKIIVLKIEERI